MDTPPPIRVVADDPEERSMAALAHGSVILNLFIPGLGLVAAAAIWLTQRERSRYAGQQAMQATIFQGILLLITVLAALAAFAVFTVVAITNRFDAGAFFLIPMALFGMLFLCLFLLFGFLYGLVGAYETYRGRDFRYWLVGNMVENRR